MNFTVVYELRDRLETAAIAGVSLIQEDFRLKRAIEQIAPLSKASPVFQKIYQMSCKTIDPSCQDRAGVLLDTLALLDAVLCTQGNLSKEDAFIPITKQTSFGKILTNIPYSQMAPVLEAFQGTGSGRYAVIRDTHEQRPEIFEDYRIKYLMIKALGDSYGELSDMVAGWLETEGPQIIPLLKHEFDPEGKRDMVRRVQIIEAIAGKEENQFYLELLPKAGKEVKEAAIHALRHENDNVNLLLDLVKSEKGKVKEAAFYSLACMDRKSAEEYWTKQMEKKPAKAVEYLEGSSVNWASDLIADYLNQWMDTFDYSQIPWNELKPEDRTTLVNLWKGASRKHSPKLCSCYKRVYQVIPDKIVQTLQESLMNELTPELCQTAEELYQIYGDPFLESVFLIDLLTKEPETVYERFKHYLQSEETEDKSAKAKKMSRKDPDPAGIFKIFLRLKYEEELQMYVIYREPGDNNLRYQTEIGKLEKGLAPGWYSLLLNYKGRFSTQWKKSTYYYYSFYYYNDYDSMIAELFHPDDESLKQAYAKYFYHGARLRGTTAGDIRMLKRCGWTDYHGLLSFVAKRDQSRIAYDTRVLLMELPLNNEQLAEELKLLIKNLGKKAVNGISILERWLEELQNGSSVNDLKYSY